MSLPKTQGSPALAKFMFQYMATRGLTLRDMVETIQNLGYKKVSISTLGRWIETGAVPPLKDPANMPIFAIAFETTPRHLAQLTGMAQLFPRGQWDELFERLPPRLLVLLNQLTPEELERGERLLRTAFGREK